MASANVATLQGLPTELMFKVCSNLGKSDLLALREVSRYFASVTVAKLSEQLVDYLSELQVLVTEEGLQIFHGLTQVPEFVAKMKNISVIGDISHALIKLRSNESLKLDKGQRERLQELIKQQAAFELKPGRAIELLAKALRNLKHAPKSQRIICDHRNHGRNNPETCGKKVIFKKIQLDLSQKQRFRGTEFDQDALLTYSILFRALNASGFEKKSVDLRTSPDTIRDQFLPSDGDTQDMAGIPYLRKLTISVEEYDEWHSDTSRHDWSWLAKCIHSASKVECLSVSGCWKKAECTICSLEGDRFDRQYRCSAPGDGCPCCQTISGSLKSATFGNLCKLKLLRMTLDENMLVNLLMASKDTIETIMFYAIELNIGSWLSVFRLMADMPNISSLRLKRLYQSIGTETDSTNLLMPSLYEYKAPYQYRRYMLGKKDVARYLGRLITTFEARMYRLSEYAFVEVDLPRVDYASPLLERCCYVTPTFHYLPPPEDGMDGLDDSSEKREKYE